MRGLSEIVAVNNRAAQDALDREVEGRLQRIADDLAAVKSYVDEGAWAVVESGRVGGTLSLMAAGLPLVANELGLAEPKISNAL